MSSNWTEIVVWVFAILLITNCKGLEAEEAEDRLLARVYNKSLYLSDMEGMLPQGISLEDSTLIIDKFVANWVREAALLREAEQNIPQGLDIDQLVEDYRASLIKHNYENLLIDKMLDSTITTAELQDFYDKNKEQYKLEMPIIQCKFIKAPNSLSQLNDAKKWWANDSETDFSLLQNWCAANGIIHYLNENSWHKVEDIGSYMPVGMLTVDNFENRKSFVRSEGNFTYMFELLNHVPKGEFAPLSYVEEQAKIVILHKRKTELLEDTKDKLYDEAMRKNGVTIFQ